MSVFVTTITSIWCDYPKCDHSYERHLPRSVATEDAFKEGWTGVGNAQFCPDHPRGTLSMDAGEK